MLYFASPCSAEAGEPPALRPSRVQKSGITPLRYGLRHLFRLARSGRYSGLAASRRCRFAFGFEIPNGNLKTSAKQISRKKLHKTETYWGTHVPSPRDRAGGGKPDPKPGKDSGLGTAIREKGDGVGCRGSPELPPEISPLIRRRGLIRRHGAPLLHQVLIEIPVILSFPIWL